MGGPTGGKGKPRHDHTSRADEKGKPLGGLHKLFFTGWDLFTHHSGLVSAPTRYQSMLPKKPWKCQKDTQKVTERLLTKIPAGPYAHEPPWYGQVAKRYGCMAVFRASQIKHTIINKHMNVGQSDGHAKVLNIRYHLY